MHNAILIFKKIQLKFNFQSYTKQKNAIKFQFTTIFKWNELFFTDLILFYFLLLYHYINYFIHTLHKLYKMTQMTFL